MMTVGELREKLKDLPDDMPVEICTQQAGEDLDVNAASVYDDEVFLLEN